MFTYNIGVCSIASGSKGNATYITDRETGILIDAGISAKEILRRLSTKNISHHNIHAIVISHEHDDHISGLCSLSKKYKLPVYVTRATLEQIHKKHKPIDNVRYFECGMDFSINNLHIHPFSISHDAVDPSGFTISKADSKVGIATDLGIATHMVKTHLDGCQLIIIEANHDPVMLKRGPYPWHLKQRIQSRLGHLSNEQTRDLLTEIMHPQLCYVVLGHMSEKNNTTQRALDVISQVIPLDQVSLTIAPQHECGEMRFV